MAEQKRIASLSVYSKDLGIDGELALVGTPAQLEKKFGSAALVVGEVTHWGTFNLRETKDGAPVVSLSGFEESAPIKGGVLFKNEGTDGHTYLAGEFDKHDGQGVRATANVMSQDATLKPLGDVVMKKDLKKEDEPAPSSPSPATM